jgi:outer membrane protein assembly factor BamB
MPRSHARSLGRALCLAAAGVAGTNAARASDWTRFRGPNGTGVSADAGLPAEIGRDRNVLWSVPLPKGNSSPIVVDGRVFLTGYEGDERLALCYDAATGRAVWRKSVTKARTETFHPINGPTTPTPATDGRSVFVFFPEVGLLAYGRDGQELWRTPLGPFASVQGLATSPIHVEGRVVLLVDTPEEAYLAAFDAATGRQVWKTARPTGVLGSYTTPTTYAPADGPVQIVVAGALELTAYDAGSGARIWWAPGVASFPAAPPFVAGDSVFTVEPGGGVSWPPFTEPLTQFDANKDGRIEIAEAASDPIWARSLKGIDDNLGNRDGIVTKEEYATADGGANDGGLVRTRLGGKGDVRKTNVVWRQDKGMPFLSGALLYHGVLSVVRNAVVSAFDPETGKLLNQQRLKNALGEYYASPVAGDGKIYIASLDGKVTVLRAGADAEVVSTGDLGEPVVATPAIADGRVLIRTEKTLYAFAGARPIKDARGETRSSSPSSSPPRPGRTPRAAPR